MRAVVQRTARAAVRVEGSTVGHIGAGLLVLLSVGADDGDAVAVRLAGRVATLRIFPDDAGRMNRDLTQAAGAVLVVSQFTLHADTSRGHRPSFIHAGAAREAERLYGVFVAALRDLGLQVQTGQFGTHMEVELVNDGPVTLVLSSGEDAWKADAG
ncbi:MAG: D-tyrosyl-tRNA(Tyr) deacylase [Candidatus Dormibacteraeota bacterium]|uniref:D-aminoacyl-tRNA deacylase n=1 Tax=Candidatus Aeolococcus gillhamiae TaxID=3127015 RepID=A0A2W5Z6G7_9BACT|nr:D-tyrosyl-tRNA(Tyr) deacylase [Candidatus Dormibacteraeota bacterium]PZR80902.1 MAG: D-tyrosyl-tRNA(Tyr) deacylase [Candidatus Dormibacter sp. RRmetagenome_bin12]